jgi:uncharacterized membrane protein YczE
MLIMFRQLLTETDNETQDVFRWLVVLCVFVGLGLQVFAILKNQHFDMMQYGTGIGALLLGAGAALKLKPESPANSTSTTFTETIKATT